MDRFAHKYPSLTPYQYAANNPMLFIDINGDSLFVYGSQKNIDTFTQIANNKLGGFHNVSVDKNGLVSVTATGKKGKMSASQTAFLGALNGAASFNVGAVKIGLVSGDNSVDVGSYNASLIDIADVAAFGDGGASTAAGVLGHEVFEQSIKQLQGLPDVRKLDDTDVGYRNFLKAHTEALNAQNNINGSQKIESLTYSSRRNYQNSRLRISYFVKAGQRYEVLQFMHSGNVGKVVQRKF